MAIASGVQKQLRFKKETTWGTLAGATGGQVLRRVESDLSLVKNTYESAEIVDTHQILDFRHGAHRVEGSIRGELSPNTYSSLMQSTLRKDFVSGSTTGALTTVAAAAGPPGTFTRSAGSYLTDGFKVGDVVRWSGWTTGGSTANNARNYRIIALTATVMSVIGTGNETVVAQAAGDSVTCTVVGKKSWIPITSHTSDAYTFEHWFADIAQSEQFTGCRMGSMAVSLPAEGLAGVTFGVLGRTLGGTGTSAYFTSPTPATTQGIAAAVNGTLRFGSADVAVVTGIDFTLDLGLTQPVVVGSVLAPGQFFGRSRVTGSLTAFFEDETLRDLFVNETEAELHVRLDLTSAINSDFLSFVMTRIKVGGSSKNDGEEGIVQTMPFQALIDTTGSGTAYEQTTLSIQDSTL